MLILRLSFERNYGRTRALNSNFVFFQNFIELLKFLLHLWISDIENRLSKNFMISTLNSFIHLLFPKRKYICSSNWLVVLISSNLMPLGLDCLVVFSIQILLRGIPLLKPKEIPAQTSPVFHRI